MPLTEIEYGSLASSAIMNDNFEYLDNRITTVAGDLTSATTSIYSNIASMNSSFSEQNESMASDIDDLEDDIVSLRSALAAQNYIPNYSSAIAINYSNGDAAGFDGWLAIKLFSSIADVNSYVKINGVAVGGLGTGSASGGVDASACMVIVSSTDVITWNNMTTINFYKIPFLGGE